VIAGKLQPHFLQ